MLTNSATFETPGRLLPALQRYGPAWTCAAAGFLSGFTVSLVGQTPAGELIMLAVFPWVTIRSYFVQGWPTRMQQLGWFQLLLILAAITAAGYVVSDLYRATAFENLIRGWARVGFLIMNLIAVAYLIDGRWQRLHVFVLSLYAGSTVNALINGPLHGEWWQFGFGYTTTVFALYACAGRHAALQIIIAVVLGGVSIFLGARSLGAICIVTAGLFALPHARGVWRPIALAGSLLMVVGLLVSASALVIARQDHAGSNVERQSMVELAAELFIASPLVGQGSWFTAGDGLEKLETKRATIDDSFRNYREEEARKLAIHSQLLVALAEGGLLGGAFFLGLAALVLKTLRNLTRSSVPHRAFAILFVLNGTWNLFMSPFSGVARLEIALLVAACLLVILQRQGELSEDYRE